MLRSQRCRHEFRQMNATHHQRAPNFEFLQMIRRNFLRRQTNATDRRRETPSNGFRRYQNPARSNRRQSARWKTDPCSGRRRSCRRGILPRHREPRRCREILPRPRGSRHHRHEIHLRHRARHVEQRRVVARKQVRCRQRMKTKSWRKWILSFQLPLPHAQQDYLKRAVNPGDKTQSYGSTTTHGKANANPTGSTSVLNWRTFMHFQRCAAESPARPAFSGGGFHAEVVHFNHRITPVAKQANPFSDGLSRRSFRGNLVWY